MSYEDTFVDYPARIAEREPDALPVGRVYVNAGFASEPKTVAYDLTMQGAVLRQISRQLDQVLMLLRRAEAARNAALDDTDPDRCLAEYDVDGEP